VLQVTTRNGIGAAKAAEAPADSTAASEVIEPRATWRHRVRSLLCCLAPPATDQYYRSSETEAVVVRRLAQPVPPHHYTGSPVIGPMSPGDAGKKTLVLDLDETLVHSSFKPIPNPDYIIPVRPD
jgi:RNA polymerase II subunit A small phosphatase-like protein